VAVGCGQDPGIGEPVTAVLMQGGQPVVYEGDEESDDDDFGYEVKMYLLDESGSFADAQECSGDLSEGEEITIYGPMMADVPPGTYRVAVYNWGPGRGLTNPEDEDSDVRKVDLLEGKYSKENSQMTVDVKPGSRITINLDDGAAS
jgi:hypothetical protein